MVGTKASGNAPGKLPERARPAFPLVRKVRYFDTATKAPMATPVRAALEAFLEQRQTEYVDKAAWRSVVERARMRFAMLIGSKTDEIAAIKNTSEGLNAIAHSIPWRPGDNVVVPRTEHPNNLYPWLHLRRRYEVEVRLAPCDDGVVTVEALTDRMDARTRAVVVSAVSFIPGGRVDLAALGRICQQREAYLIVDAIQALGLVRLNVVQDGIDALAAGGHKGLLGPYGVGFMYCRSHLASGWEPAYRARASVQPNDEPYSFVSDPNPKLLGTAARYEIGNYNYEGLHALEAALGFLGAFDPGEVEAHVLSLSQRLSLGLQDLGIEPLSPVDDVSRSSIVSFRPSDAAGLRRKLVERRIAAALKGDALRFSFHLFNTEEEVDSLLEDLGDLLGP